MASNGNPVEVVFFDARDTLGEVDRPGHLVPYRPSTEKLLSSMKEAGLTIGVITNLPEDVTADQGRAMVVDCILSDNGGEQIVRIGDFIDADHVFTNHELGLDKPNPAIFRKAAEQMGVTPDRCMFVGENLIEVLSARAAGLQSELKPCPPGREFMPAPLTQKRGTQTYSGRAFEDFFETEHLLGDRIFACGEEICRQLRALDEGSPIPDDVMGAMGILIYLTNNFADQAHLKAEEAAVPIAVARGLDPDDVNWVFLHHDQGRAYFRGMDIAWRRIQAADEDPTDLPWAIDAFVTNTEGFVRLFIHHAERENDELYPRMGEHFSDMDDAIVLNLVGQIGPRDFTPYIGLVVAMEERLGLNVPA
jgi:hemerythrin-like domain-containing protein/histidinol phosphatase-like enzyme